MTSIASTVNFNCFIEQKENYNEVDLVKYLDISLNDDAIDHCWRTGRIPQFIRQFRNLEVLRAPKMGIIVIDEWICELKELKALYLEENEITTWPQHLILLPKLKVLYLDGNPCLEEQFQKSPSFRSAFFSGEAHSFEFFQGLGPKVLGPEWKMATLKRRTSASLRGYYCGGIYILGTPRREPHCDGQLTRLGPSRLERRRGRPPPLKAMTYRYNSESDVPSLTWRSSSSCFDCGDVVSLRCPDTESDERSVLILELLHGIAAVSGTWVWNELHAIDYDLDIPPRNSSIYNVAQLKKDLAEFIQQESVYIMKLSEAIRIFFSPSLNKQWAKELAHIFDPFPALYLVHSRQILPLLKKAYRRLRKGRDPTLERLNNEMLAMLLSGKLSCYEDYGDAYTVSQCKLWKCHNADNVGEELVRSTRFGEWLYKEALDNPLHSMQHAQNYLELPLLRMESFCSLFLKMSRSFPRLAPTYNKLRHSRDFMIDKIESARRGLRILKLSAHYKLVANVFRDYHWDALLDVKSRVFLEPGCFKAGTHDVLTSEGPMSVVTELFARDDRAIRIVCAEFELQLWDETVGKLIGIIAPGELRVYPTACQNTFKLVFGLVYEACVCELLSFTSALVTNSTENLSFLQVAQNCCRV